MKRALTVPSLLLGLVCLGISVGALSAAGQTATATSSSVDSKDQAILAVSIIRVINTAEVGDCRTKDGKIDEGAKFLA